MRDVEVFQESPFSVHVIPNQERVSKLTLVTVHILLLYRYTTIERNHYHSVPVHSSKYSLNRSFQCDLLDAIDLIIRAEFSSSVS